MNKAAVVTILGAAVALASFACGAHPVGSGPATSPPPASAAPAPDPPPAAPLASASAPASAPPPSASGSASASGKPPDVMTTGVSGVSNEITTPNVVSPDKVIASLRPKFNACFADGLKKDPKISGSVTLSAKIEKDGKVSAVAPKMLTGFSPAVVKCLSDQLKGANFTPAGGMNYTTSLDIPLSFTSNQ